MLEIDLIRGSWVKSPIVGQDCNAVAADYPRGSPLLKYRPVYFCTSIAKSRGNGPGLLVGKSNLHTVDFTIVDGLDLSDAP